MKVLLSFILLFSFAEPRFTTTDCVVNNNLIYEIMGMSNRHYLIMVKEGKAKGTKIKTNIVLFDEVTEFKVDRKFCE